MSMIDSITLNSLAGMSIHQVVNKAIDAAVEYDCKVRFEFNGMWVEVDKGSVPVDVVRWWGQIKEAQAKTHGASVTPTGIKWGNNGR